MSGSVNKVILLGNLARDPEVRSTQGGQKIVNLTVATSERWRDKASGEQKEKAEFHRVVVFNENLADVAEKYLTKGRPVYLEGMLQTRKWTDQSGAERYSTEIVLSRFKGELVLLGGGEREDHSPGAGKKVEHSRERSGGGGGRPPAGTLGSHDDLDDAIPF